MSHLAKTGEPSVVLPLTLQNAVVPEEVLRVLARLRERGHQAFLVGGCVRDLLRGANPKDFDVATSATPPQVTAAFAKVIPTGVEHGTVTVLTRGRHLEVTTFRSEAPYLDGRRPSKVVFESQIDQDLSRRDFTINAMAFDPAAGVLVDPFGGQHDLAARRIRCVREARERFAEDGLRALRAVRFAAVLDFEVEEGTLAAIPLTLATFRKVALERVRDELTKLLLAGNAPRGLDLLVRSRLWNEVLPELPQPPEGIEAELVRRVAAVAPILELRLALLFDAAPDRTESALRRLKFPAQLISRVGNLQAHALHGLEHSDADLRKWLARAGPAQAPLILDFSEARSGIDLEPLRRRMQTILATKPPLSARDLALDGEALMAHLGIGPSPQIGKATRHLLDAVLDNPALNTPEQLKELLSRWKSG